MILAARAFEASSRPVSSATSFFLNAEGTERELLLSAVLAIRDTMTSGSRQSGGEVAA